MNPLADHISSLLGLGLEAKDLTFLQISLRGFVVFLAALVLVRLSDRRGLTKKSPFDQLLIVILASVLARAINGSSTFFATIGGAAVLVFLHRALAFASCRWPVITSVIKGRPAALVRDGEWRVDVLRQKNISSEDVMEDMRLSAQIEQVEKVKVARLEVSGDISFILADEKA
jgi:uncharacterized membrane protein YcaP (DUF421 family)